MDKERAIEVFIAETMKEYISTYLVGHELNEEDRETVLNLLGTMKYVSLHDDYEKYYNEHKSQIDIAFGVKNLPANTFTVTYVNENVDGSADVDVEMGPGMKDKILEAGLNFMLIKAILGGTTEEILDWATRGKEEVNADDVTNQNNETRAVFGIDY